MKGRGQVGGNKGTVQGQVWGDPEMPTEEWKCPLGR